MVGTLLKCVLEVNHNFVTVRKHSDISIGYSLQMKSPKTNTSHVRLSIHTSLLLLYCPVPYYRRVCSYPELIYCILRVFINYNRIVHYYQRVFFRVQGMLLKYIVIRMRSYENYKCRYEEYKHLDPPPLHHIVWNRPTLTPLMMLNTSQLLSLSEMPNYNTRTCML